jgi:hypothetical protein
MKTIILLILCAGSVIAQQIGNPTAQQGVIPARGTFAIRNARIVTVSGPDIENGTVVIRDGKIEAVGVNVSVPAGAQTIDGNGLSVYPGMIDAGTNMGLVEVPQGANGTVDTSEVGDLNPNAKAIIAVNPHSAHIAVTRVEGITNTLTAPTGGLISGQAALINLLGTSPKEMAVVALVASSNNPQISPILWPRTRACSNRFAKCYATLKLTVEHRTLTRKTSRCPARIATSCSNRSCRTFVANSR